MQPGNKQASLHTTYLEFLISATSDQVAVNEGHASRMGSYITGSTRDRSIIHQGVDQVVTCCAGERFPFQLILFTPTRTHGSAGRSTKVEFRTVFRRPRNLRAAAFLFCLGLFRRP